MNNDPLQIEQQFLQINQARLDRLGESLSSRQWDLLTALSLLLHLNHPDLPGFAGEEVPNGIRNYLPSEDSINAINRMVTGFRYQQQAARQYSILSIFMMGSSGSIAFSSVSDFDVWVCVEQQLPDAERQLLQLKFNDIERWADKNGVELHFFIVDSAQFQSGEVESMSSESSGTAQRFLLLEEFYRTSILLSGLPPLWWIVPAEEEDNYDEFIEAAQHKPGVKLTNFIDFGPLNNIPVEEFTGAGLWQVFKGIDSPYKSLMKIILMEAYIHEHPHTQLVSLSYKQRVQDGTTELERLDPYLLMFEKAESFLLETEQQGRVEFLRHCFYLKIGEHLSQTLAVPSVRRELRRRLMRNYVNNWGWSDKHLETLDQRNRWRISQIMEETHQIHRELSNSYTQLSRSVSEHTSSTAISELDLHVLARRIYAALERKPGKVEIVNRKTNEITAESALAINKARTKSGHEVWLLYNQASYSDPDTKPIKRFATPVELTLWCILNGVIARYTRWLVNQRQTDLGERELTMLNRFVEGELPLPGVLKSTTEDLAAPLRYTHLLILVNFGFEPFARYMRKGLRLTSSRSDPLSYGDSKLNTVQKIDLVYRSAWGEITCHNHSGDDTVGTVLQQYLIGVKSGQENFPTPKFFSFSEQNGDAAAVRIDKLFATARDFFGQSNSEHRRFIYPISASFGMIEQSGAGLHYATVTSRSELEEILAAPQNGPVSTYIDKAADTLGDLCLMTRRHLPGVIQIFIEIDGDDTRFHILDEGGAYLVQQTATFELQAHLRHLQYFVGNICRRLRLADQNFGTDNQTDVLFYKLVRTPQGSWQQRQVEVNFKESGDFVDIHALAVPSTSGSPALSIIYEGEEFSSLEWGSDLYHQVAAKILAQRSDGENYPIYLTDIELASSISGNQNLQSIHYFKYKKAIEERLTTALHSNPVMQQLTPSNI